MAVRKLPNYRIGGGLAMTQRCKILVVAPSTSLAGTVLMSLADVNHEGVFATTFAAGKMNPDARPALLITGLKLGEYNGVHLALRGRAAGVPSIVLGPTDQTFRRQAEQLGAVYATCTDIECSELRTLIGKLVARPEPEDPFDSRFSAAYAGVRRPLVVH